MSKFLSPKNKFFTSLIATSLAVSSAWAGRTNGAAPVAPVNSGMNLTGSIFKHNISSDMRVNLNLKGSDTDGSSAGYAVFGDTITTVDYRQENALINFERVNFRKIGTNKSDANAIEIERNQKAELVTQELDNYGVIHVSGLMNGTRVMRDEGGQNPNEIILSGTSLVGSLRQEEAGGLVRTGDAINFENLSVNGINSKGRMRYLYYLSGKGGGYQAENGLSFGKYAISSPSGKNNIDHPIISFDAEKNLMTLNMLFGDLKITGTIQFTDKTETELRQYTVKVQDPYTSMMISQQRMDMQMRRMDRVFDSRPSSFGDILVDSMQNQMENQMLNSLDQMTSHTEVRTSKITTVVATEGLYNLNIESKTGEKINVSKNVSNFDGSTETQLRAVLAYLLLTAYDSFSQ